MTQAEPEAEDAASQRVPTATDTDSNQAQETASAAEGTIGTLTVTNWTDTHPWLDETDMANNPIEQQSVHIADFARRMRTGGATGVVLREKTFENCHIYGPAVLVPLDTGEVGGKVFVRCQKVGQEDAFGCHPIARLHRLERSGLKTACSEIAFLPRSV